VIWDLEAIQKADWVQTLDYFDELGSTNDHALATADDNRRHPRLVLCNQQNSGRGRGNNRWTVTPGALTFSLVIEPDEMGIPRERWPTLSVAVGGAICEAISALLPSCDVRLKWPNDVYVDGRKMGGILVEVPPVNPPRLVIGVGLNVQNSVREAPLELQKRMVAISDLTENCPTRSAVLERVLAQLAHDFSQLAVDPVSLAHGWRSRCFLTGRTVTLNDGLRTLTGACQGIDDDGALRIYTEFGPQRCLAGTIQAFE
jgi:BirA family biotin operon repressor/biotin-[acetyl-CoA-carboxylase] ligase